MGVFTQVASNIKAFARKFAHKSAYACCVNGALALFPSEEQMFEVCQISQEEIFFFLDESFLEEITPHKTLKK